MNRTLLGRALLAACVTLLASNVEATPVTYALFFDGTFPSEIVEIITPNGSTTVDRATVNIFSDFGSNGIRVTGQEAFAVSGWRDEWTVTGGTGTMEVLWSLTGSFTINPPAPICTTCLADGASITYSSLFGSVSISPFGSPIITVTQDGPGTQTVQRTGSLLVNYTPGVMFGAGFLLAGGLGDDFYGGEIDFLDTALITAVILSDGATLTTTSGTTYPVISAPAPAPVPEPATVLLLAPGLLALGVRRWRRESADYLYRGKGHPGKRLPKWPGVIAE